MLSYKARTAFSLFLVTLASACGPVRFLGEKSGPTTAPVETGPVEALLAQMTLEEKIGQLTLYSSDRDSTGGTVRPEYKEEIKAGRVGAIFNAYDSAFTRDLQQLAVENTRLRIPMMFGYDVVHGFKTIFPIPLGETASWDLGAIEQSARVAATEAAAGGVQWTYAPMVDIARDPRWGRIAEGAGEDTYLGSVVAAVRVRGFQGEGPGHDDAVLSTVKHFAAYGAAEGGRDYNSVDMSERTLREVYLPPFKAAVDAGAASVMTSFNAIAGVPSSANRWLLQNILRDEWQFSGFVVSDYTAINELIPHGVAADLSQAGELAINAGVDMDMQGAVYRKELANSVAAGRVPMSTIDEAVRRILTAKYRLGLFDDPYKFCNEDRERERILTPETRGSAHNVAKRSIVLLKNDNNLLPLSKNLQKIALVGPLGADQANLLGPWSGAGAAENVINLLDGIKAKVSATTQILVAKGSELTGDDTAGFAEAIRVATQSDVIIAALGEAASMSGEAASRASIELPGPQLALLQELQKLGKPLVLVLMNGRPLLLNWPQEHVPAILETWFLGSESGPAIADVLFGDYNPSGRLPVSFPRSGGQIPLYYNALNTGRPFAADYKYTSKYLDVPNTPLYPFGFGLSYSQFNYTNFRIDTADVYQGTEVVAHVDVSNAGPRDGRETVQLYVTDEVASVARPVKELRAFTQIDLAVGETKTVDLHVKTDALGFYGLDMKRVVEAGTFKIAVGPNSDQLQTLEFTLH